MDVYSKQLLPIGDQILTTAARSLWREISMPGAVEGERVISLCAGNVAAPGAFYRHQRRRAFGRPLDFVFYRGLNSAKLLYWLRALPITIRYSLNQSRQA